MNKCKIISKYISTTCMAAFLNVAGCSSVDINDNTYNVSNTSDDTTTRVYKERISPRDFKIAHPKFANTNFSAIGSLTINGYEECSAVLLEPSNLIASIGHCLYIDDATKIEDKFSFITSDASGKTHIIPLPVHDKEGDFKYLHIPNITTLEQDDPIVFFELNQPLPEGIEPASIAPAQTTPIQEVFAAGYSPFMRDIEGKNDIGLSISEKPCHQTINPKTPDTITSTCAVDGGDSGGATITINNDGKIAVSSIISDRIVEKGKRAISDIFSRSNIEVMNYDRAASKPLALMRDFCLKNIGANYCTGFPIPAPTPEPN